MYEISWHCLKKFKKLKCMGKMCTDKISKVNQMLLFIKNSYCINDFTI